jgi:uridine kinase
LSQSPQKRPVLVAIVGGSGSGKSWLADRLAAASGHGAVRISQDDFYRDRSHLGPARRATLNFDHPRSIDWKRLVSVLTDLKSGKSSTVPIYDFATHTRSRKTRRIRAAQVVYVDGLWLLRTAMLRKFFSFSVFLKSPATVRLRRRLTRDCFQRARDARSIRRQFRAHVEPMHRKFVSPQAKYAHWICTHDCGKREIALILARVRGVKIENDSERGSNAKEASHARSGRRSKNKSPGR